MLVNKDILMETLNKATEQNRPIQLITSNMNTFGNQIFVDPKIVQFTFGETQQNGLTEILHVISGDAQINGSLIQVISLWNDNYTD